MNDRYLYRAKRTDNGEWVEGFYVNAIEEHGNGERTAEIVALDAMRTFDGISPTLMIDPSTICQCTGLKDKNGKLIWENDIVKINGVVYICFWNKSNFEWGFKNNAEDFGVAYVSSDEINVIGSVIDNPELLEVGE
ncbi:MAG: YopX family protein [Lachnospiraceae bacterium]